MQRKELLALPQPARRLPTAQRAGRGTGGALCGRASGCSVGSATLRSGRRARSCRSRRSVRRLRFLLSEDTVPVRSSRLRRRVMPHQHVTGAARIARAERPGSCTLPRGTAAVRCAVQATLAPRALLYPQPEAAGLKAMSRLAELASDAHARGVEQAPDPHTGVSALTTLDACSGLAARRARRAAPRAACSMASGEAVSSGAGGAHLPNACAPFPPPQGAAFTAAAPPSHGRAPAGAAGAHAVRPAVRGARRAARRLARAPAAALRRGARAGHVAPFAGGGGVSEPGAEARRIPQSRYASAAHALARHVLPQPHVHPAQGARGRLLTCG